MPTLSFRAAGRVLFATLALWIGVVTAPLAFQLSQTEVLNYRVAWGPITVGKASLAYTPPTSARGDYGIQVLLNDSSNLVNLNSSYQMAGRHSPRPFTSARYHAQQQENDYRADKVVVFNSAARTITYTNQRDASDTTPPITWDGRLRDVFSQLYAMRIGGLAVLQPGQELSVMGTKRPFTLVQSALVALPIAKGKAPLYRVVLRTRKEDGSLHRDRWQITLRQEADGTLTPIVIEAGTRFGTFTATLRGPR